MKKMFEMPTVDVETILPAETVMADWATSWEASAAWWEE